MFSKRRASPEPVEAEEERKRAKTVEAAETDGESATTQRTNAPEPSLEESNEAASTNDLLGDNVTPVASPQAPDADGNLRPTNPDPYLRWPTHMESRTTRVQSFAKRAREYARGCIIGSCTALKELIYVWDDTGRNSQVDDCKDKGADLQFPGLKRALNQHSNSLECLEIRTRRSHSPPFFTRASECSFVAYNVLKNLKIRLADVTADDSNDRSWFLGLPRSLERLTLELPDVPLSFDIPEALREFARRVPGRFSMLRKIELKAMNLPRHFADFDEFDGMVEWFSPVEVDGGEQARNWMNDEDWMADENGINDENDMALERAYEDGDYNKI